MPFFSSTQNIFSAMAAPSAPAPPAGFTIRSNGKYYKDIGSYNISNALIQANLQNAWIATPLNSVDMDVISIIGDELSQEMYMGFKKVEPAGSTLSTTEIFVVSENHPRYGEIITPQEYEGYWIPGEPNSSTSLYVSARPSAAWQWRDQTGTTAYRIILEWYPT